VSRRTPAGDYITNLLKRGVITTGGADAAHKNLVGQEATARSKLSELAKGSSSPVGRERQTSLASKRLVQHEKLGDTFDPNTVGTDLSKYFADFFSGLGTKVRGVARRTCSIRQAWRTLRVHHKGRQQWPSTPLPSLASSTKMTRTRQQSARHHVAVLIQEL